MNAVAWKRKIRDDAEAVVNAFPRLDRLAAISLGDPLGSAQSFRDDKGGPTEAELEWYELLGLHFLTKRAVQGAITGSVDSLLILREEVGR
jgi:hypothetical protein